ncbi:hypothetical protein SAMN05421749_104173 [Acinetobacter marinus]|uniref:NF038105 family protein n=1 Tax=Acinetobacter marinus TaxID=281375 RepID=A0A1G6KTH5_9GAMM|nr:NF038105 family protein [Acinetobacter marinus]SDC34081.1 hypothetical protein SAMN05421749_104173 [Acinetobacter marinus]
MTTMKFDEMPTAVEEIDMHEIENESVKQAWQAYEAKPEYKDFNKHDLIESMLEHGAEEKQLTATK